MKSVMSHSFSEVPKAEIQRSSFDRSHGLKTSFDADYLIPILVDEVIPGDTYNVRCNFFARLATPIHPIMDNIYFETFFFFVPNRLLWINWEKFCGAQDDPGDSIDFTIPGFTVATNWTLGSLGDYMGLPIDIVDVRKHHSVLPFRAYALIYNEWFRDQNLQDSIVVSTANGPDTTTGLTLLKRGKRHDYFTSSLPWPQKGTAVSMPLGSSANVETFATALISGVKPRLIVNTEDGALPGQASVLNVDTSGGVWAATTSSGTIDDHIYPTNLYADLSTATAATVNDVRLAFQTQKLLERDARSGTRYNETIKAHFGIKY